MVRGCADQRGKPSPAVGEAHPSGGHCETSSRGGMFEVQVVHERSAVDHLVVNRGAVAGGKYLPEAVGPVGVIKDVCGQFLLDELFGPAGQG